MKHYKLNRLFKFLLLTILCCFSHLTYGQDSATDGQDFYISFTQNYTYNSLSTMVKAQIRYVVKETSYITTQYGDGTYLDNNVLYSPGVYTKDIDKTKCYTETTTSAESNKIIRITSTKNIGVFAINLAANTTDATTVLPVSALGNNYTIISHDIGSGIASIQIISKDDGTIFTIKDSNGVVVVSNKSLAANKVYTYGKSANLTGYSVESNYNVAVISSVGCGAAVTSGGCDHNFEQMWPTNTAGKNFFLWNLSTQSGSVNTRDKIQILALEDNTEVIKKVGVSETVIPLNKHNTNSFFLDTAVHINSASVPVKLTANKPIIVEHFLGFAPSIKWISPAEQSITKAIISPFIPTGSSVITGHQLHVMIPTGSQSDMIIRETRSGVIQSVTLNYYTNISDPAYVIATKTYGATDDVLIEMANPSGFIAYMTGYGQAESYIFTAGAGAFNLQAYYTVATKTLPVNNTYYSATSTMTHTFEDIDNINIRRTIEKPFSSVKWLLNENPYSGVVENTNIINSWSFPASDLNAGENKLTMSVRFTGDSADSLYTSKLWLSGITSYPDNIVDLTCVKEADPAVWGIAESLPINKTDLIHNYAPLVVGDIDNDNKIEIIGLQEDNRDSNGYESNGIKIFNYENNEIKLKKSFDIATGGSSTASFGSMAIARYNNQGYIVLVGVDRYLYAYGPDGTRLWKSDEICSKTTINLVNIADFNNDGIPEVYVDNNIFSLASGKLLCSGGANNTGSMGTSGSSPMAIDVDNDGKLELCAGTQIYKVNITNPNGQQNNSMDVILDMGLSSTKLPQHAIADGMTQLVDMDGDGMLEIVVTSRLNNRVVVYVWKPLPNNNSYLMGSYLVPATNATYNSIPMIGDIDNDGYPEIVFITNGSSFLMYALDFDPTLPIGSMLREKWTLAHTDGSGCTGMSLFDFNLDGTAEIVYRDETTLRIIDGSGSTPVVKETFNNVKSGTLREYPIIADLDKDGQAEIIVTGSDGSATNQNAYLRVFKSSQTQWAPARSVWNQYNYNSVNVNEDLTIPATQFPITTRFKGKDGIMSTADDIRVFNNFRQQQTYLNKDGVAFMKIPNAKVLDPNDIKFTYNSDDGSLVVSNLIVTNVGEASLKDPLNITTYKDEVSASSRKHLYNYPVSIGVNETYAISFTIPNFNDWLPVDKLIVKVNDVGDGINDQEVCDSCCVNNESDAFVNVSFDNIAWADSYRKCEGGNVTFKSITLPGSSVNYKWLKPDGFSLLDNAQNTSLSNLGLIDAGRYIFEVTGVNGNLSLKYTLPYLSVAPQVMYWRSDSQDHNWNNINNWAKTATLGDNLQAIPAECTTVHLPGKSSFYPSLEVTSAETDIYGEAVADNIIFHYGSELGYPHKLTYNKAHIHYNWGYYNGNYQNQTINSEGNNIPFLSRDTWHMLAAPLKKIASGDFALGGYPLTWQTHYNTLHPSSGSLIEGDFGKAFSRNDIDLSSTHNALAIKVAAYTPSIGYNNHAHLENLKGILEIPYFENEAQSSYHPGHLYNKIRKESRFYPFNEQTLQPLSSPVGTMARSQEAYRFVYEEENAAPLINGTSEGVATQIPGYIQHIELESGNTTRKVMIGNPFMASINSHHFYQANSSILDPGARYSIFDPVNQDWPEYQYKIENNIPALQAIVITLRDGITSADISYPLEGDNALTGADYINGSTTRSLPAGHSLYLRTTDGSNTPSDYAVLNPGQEEPTSRITKTIYPGSRSTEAFIITGDQEYTLIDFVDNSQSQVGIGIKSTNQQDVLSLEFENVETFKYTTGLNPVLVDKYLNIEQDLSSQNTYRFHQRATSPDAQYADTDRFALRLISATSGITDATNSGDHITVHHQMNQLEVNSEQGMIQVEVYDLQGRHLHNSGKLPDTPLTYTKYLPLNQGVYIVKVKTSDGKIVAKKINVV